MNKSIPKPVTPFIDERTGNISREWFLYLASLGDEVSEVDVWLHMHT